MPKDKARKKENKKLKDLGGNHSVNEEKQVQQCHILRIRRPVISNANEKSLKEPESFIKDKPTNSNVPGKLFIRLPRKTFDIIAANDRKRMNDSDENTMENAKVSPAGMSGLFRFRLENKAKAALRKEQKREYQRQYRKRASTKEYQIRYQRNYRRGEPSHMIQPSISTSILPKKSQDST